MTTPRWLSVAVLLLLASVGAERSKLSCQQLRLDATTQGGPSVCGASRVVPDSPFPNRPNCPKNVDWNTAADICMQAGMRLCTSREVASDEVKATGCNLDNARVWTASTEQCTAGLAAVAQCGSSSCTEFPRACAAMSLELGVRCCGDAVAIVAAAEAVPAEMQRESQSRTSESSSPKLAATVPVKQEVAALRQVITAEDVNSPCSGSPCAQDLDQMNLCVVASAESYSCSCHGFRYLNTEDRQSCRYLPDACRGNVCNRLLSRANICMDNFDGTFRCKCDDSNFQISADGKDCIPFDDPCDTTPCGTVPSNTCVSLKDGAYVCVCMAYRYLDGPDKQSCVLTEPPCGKDPCNSAADARNKCYEVGTGYKCLCSGVDWKTSTDSQACDYFKDDCQRHDRCQTTADASNVCSSLRGGSYKCNCRGIDWAASEDGLDCVLRSNACDNDPCRSNRNPLNKCAVSSKSALKTHQCTCRARNYHASADNTTCILSTNKCTSSDDPCQISLGNKCSFGCTVSSCAHSCSCEKNFLEVLDSGKQSSCVRSPCASDPCYTRFDTNNQCTAIDSGRYTCKCSAALWIEGVDDETRQATCLKPPGLCAEESATKLCGVSEGNGCVDINTTAFECTCRTAWIKTEAGGCESPPNLCDDEAHGRQCNAVADGGQTANACVDTEDGQYYCQCFEPGWEDGPYGQRGPLACTEPRKRCRELLIAGADPCFTSAGNFCEDRTDGTYYCTCDAPGYKNVIGAQKCQVPSNPCLGDPCHTSRDKLNVCVDMLDGTHFCQCAGRDWKDQFVKGQLLGCTFEKRVSTCDDYSMGAKPSAASGITVDEMDPCLSKEYPSNACTEIDDGASHECTCDRKGGYTPIRVGGANTFCRGPPHPCVSPEDPCASQGDLANACVVLKGINHRCICAERGYTATADEKACVGPTSKDRKNPCEGDPCKESASTRTSQNTCAEGIGVDYVCTCNADGWITAPGAQRCLEAKNPCYDEKDFCKIGPGPGTSRANECVYVAAEKSHKCVCNGRGFFLPKHELSCVKDPDPCLDNKDACRTEHNGLNECLNQNDGTYRCVCKGEGFKAEQNWQSCTCPNPCTLGDPCGILEDRNNKCNVNTRDEPGAGPNHCGSFECSCGAVGWKMVMTPWDTQRCEPPRPCKTADPCFHRFNNANECISSYSGASGSYNPAKDPLNPLNLKLQTLRKPPPTAPNPKDDGNSYMANTNVGRYGAMYDFSEASANTGSSSAMNAPNTYQTYSTASSRRGLLSEAEEEQAGQARKLLVHDSDGLYDTVASKSFYQAGGFFCSCNGLGWLTPIGAQSCIPPNACHLGDPCNTAENRDNKCVPRRSSSVLDVHSSAATPNSKDFYCECSNEGWYASPDYQTCYACEDPCESKSDPCGMKAEPSNNCTWEYHSRPNIRRQFNAPGLGESMPKCGRHICTCAGTDKLWAPTNGGKSCTKCPDACLDDPCKSKFDAGNSCTNVMLNTSKLATGVFGVSSEYLSGQQLITGNNGQVVGYLPLKHRMDKDPLLSNPCGMYQCECGGAGWVVSQAAETCERCIDPCSRDPCNTAGDRNNVCLSTFGSTSSFGMGGLSRRLLQNSFDNLPTYGEECGPYMCICGGLSWTEVQGATACSRCKDPCDQVANRDPCKIKQNAENQCIAKPNTRPGQDVAGGFGPSAGGRRLLEEDTGLQTENVTRRQWSSNLWGSTAQVSQNMPACSDFMCVCALYSDWIATPDGRQCKEDCTNKCYTQDPCRTALEPSNRCVNIPARGFETCAHHKCMCAAGWTETFGAQGCAPPRDYLGPCKMNGDPCMTKDNSLNVCIEDLAITVGGYRCECSNAEGYVEGRDDLTCFAETPQAGDVAVGPCRGHDRCETVKPGNFCTEYQTRYVCTCTAPGFQVTPEGQFCI